MPSIRLPSEAAPRWARAGPRRHGRCRRRRGPRRPGPRRTRPRWVSISGQQVGDVLGVEPGGVAPASWRRRRPCRPAAHAARRSTSSPGAPRPRRCRRSRRPGRPPPSRAAYRRPCRAVTSSGAGRPGTAAVVISTSDSATYGASSSRWRTARSSRHLPGVAAGALDRLQVQLDEGGAHRAHLVGGGGPHVVGLDDGAEPLGGRDRLQPGDPGPEHQHPGRRHGAGRGHEQREEPRQPHRRLQRAAVAGHQRLRGQRVHRLGPRDARHQLHRERRHPGRLQGADAVQLARPGDEPDGDRTRRAAGRPGPAAAAGRAAPGRRHPARHRCARRHRPPGSRRRVARAGPARAPDSTRTSWP